MGHMQIFHYTVEQHLIDIATVQLNWHRQLHTVNHQSKKVYKRIRQVKPRANPSKSHKARLGARGRSGYTISELSHFIFGIL